jgi:hypothetical protein
MRPGGGGVLVIVSDAAAPGGLAQEEAKWVIYEYIKMRFFGIRKV